MKELFYALGALALLRFNQMSGWWDIPIILTFLFIDYQFAQKKTKELADLEAMKIFLSKQK